MKYENDKQYLTSKQMAIVAMTKALTDAKIPHTMITKDHPVVNAAFLEYRSQRSYIKRIQHDLQMAEDRVVFFRQEFVRVTAELVTLAEFLTNAGIPTDDLVVQGEKALNEHKS